MKVMFHNSIYSFWPVQAGKVTEESQRPIATPARVEKVDASLTLPETKVDTPPEQNEVVAVTSDSVEVSDESKKPDETHPTPGASSEKAPTRKAPGWREMGGCF